MDKTNKTLIFLDIDGTLLDEKYKCNYSRLANLIEKLERNDIVFSLNSNRSLEDLLPVAKQFKINGPLVCENGLFTYLPKSRKTIFLISREKLKKLKDAKRTITLWIKNTKVLLNKKIHYKSTDTVALTTKTKSYSKFENSDFIFDNKFRNYTISAHIRNVANGKLQNDIQILRSLIEKITTELQKSKINNDVKIASSDMFCNLLMYSSLTDKRKAAIEIIQKFYKGYKILAIGDEISDFNIVDGLGEFWTTGNSNTGTKKLANRVAKNKFAKGVYELLTTI